MRDKGFVLSTKNDFAQIEVHCLIESCQKCSTKSFCVGQNQEKGLLTVKNYLKAQSGDLVEIEIPETRYSKSLVLLFGSLLAASLLGMGAGFFLSPLLALSQPHASILGLLAALSLTSIGLYRYFLKRNKECLYPEIINIIKKGG